MNIVPDYGDLDDPENYLIYTIDLAINYRDTLYSRKNMAACLLPEKLQIADKVLKVVANLSLLRAQLAAVQDQHLQLQPPDQKTIDAATAATASVEKLKNTDATLSGALGLLGGVLGATAELARV